MESALSVAKVLYDMYGNKYSESMDEMKMHKLMYFAQREALMYQQAVLFKDDFYGWKFGPVLSCVRKEYRKKEPFKEVKGNVSNETKQLLQNVFNRYGSLSSWKLSSLSHDELSWKKSRKGLAAKENGNVIHPRLL